MEEKVYIKPFSELTIVDDFIFSKVMKDESICREFLEMILKINIGKIEYITDQKELSLIPDTKGVILDIYLRNENKIINIARMKLLYKFALFILVYCCTILLYLSVWNANNG